VTQDPSDHAVIFEKFKESYNQSKIINFGDFASSTQRKEGDRWLAEIVIALSKFAKRLIHLHSSLLSLPSLMDFHTWY